ncbi:hypothetical protein CGT81_16545 [Vibrio cholerae]|uniref:hypothetical protein n=2 Tax=Vibrionaceae TaxID=641 RepID=UPI000BA977F7|nr:hypothetical protein [Vibrio cholerae]PAR95421.1 hypothetical protein CGT81_16545 [Vibrio cholerae]HDI3149400.1 hypothetical protein [Vibrio cholerae]
MNEYTAKMTHINLHSKLLDSTKTFCDASLVSACADEQNTALTELVFNISRYQEEGTKLHPKVYLTNNIKLALQMLPGSSSMQIGSEVNLSNAMRSALKKCAPLANNGWCIYIAQEGEQVCYGIFRGDTNPITTSIDEVVLTTDVPYNTIKVHQVTQDQVEVRSNKGPTLYISLSPAANKHTSTQSDLSKLVDCITNEVQENREFVHRILSDSLSEAIKKSHGCLIAVSTSEQPPPTFNGDGIQLSPVIDFHKLVTLCINQDKEAGALISLTHILESMINTDGIVIFNQKAQLLGFNFFIQSSSTNSFGGARSRAFEALCSKLDTELCGAYMQSQDGLTQFKGADNE